MTDPISGGGGGGAGGISSITSAGSGGDTAKQINEAAAPSQKQTGETLKASTGALNEAAQASSPNASAPPGSPNPPGTSSAASATTGANAEPNAPRAGSV